MESLHCEYTFVTFLYTHKPIVEFPSVYSIILYTAKVNPRRISVNGGNLSGLNMIRYGLIMKRV